MPPAPIPPDAAVITLLMRFSRLPPTEQTRFLDLLNAYIYASPQRRTRLREDWRNYCSTLGDDEAVSGPALEQAPRARRSG